MEFMTETQLLQFIFSGITIGCIYALVALGFTIIFNTTSIVNFAQGDFVMLGAMFAATFQSLFHFPLVIAVSLSVLCVAIIGLIMERVLIHSLKDDPRLFASVMMTMGASIIFNAISILVWGADPLSSGSLFRGNSDTDSWRDLSATNVLDCWQHFFGYDPIGYLFSVYPSGARNVSMLHEQRCRSLNGDKC